jgi:uncharacterized protein involved in tolerance to divalent cations
MTNARIVLTAAGSREEARKVAHALVERQLAASMNIVPRYARLIAIFVQYSSDFFA